MHVSITESGNYQTIGKATVKPLFSGIFCKKYFKFVIIFKREFFILQNPVIFPVSRTDLKTTVGIIANSACFVNGSGGAVFAFFFRTTVYMMPSIL